MSSARSAAAGTASPFVTGHSITHRPRERETGRHVEGHGWRPVRRQDMLEVGAGAAGASVEASLRPSPALRAVHAQDGGTRCPGCGEEPAPAGQRRPPSPRESASLF